MSLTERTYHVVAEHLKTAKPVRDEKVIYFQIRPPKRDTPSKKQQINAVKSQESTSLNAENANANEELINNIKQEFHMDAETITNPNFVKSNKITAGSAIIKSEQSLDANGNVKTVREFKCEWCQKIVAYK